MCSPLDSIVKFEADYSVCSSSVFSGIARRTGPKVTIGIQASSFKMEQRLSIDLPDSRDCDKIPLSFTLQYPPTTRQIVDVVTIPAAIAKTMVFTTQYDQEGSSVSLGVGRLARQLDACETPVLIIEKPEFEAGGRYAIHFARIEREETLHNERLEKKKPILSAVIEEIVDPLNPASVERAKNRSQAENVMLSSWASVEKFPCVKVLELSTDELQRAYQSCLRDKSIATRIIRESIRNGDDEARLLAEKAWNMIINHVGFYGSALQKRDCL